MFRVLDIDVKNNSKKKKINNNDESSTVYKQQDLSLLDNTNDANLSHNLLINKSNKSQHLKNGIIDTSK